MVWQQKRHKLFAMEDGVARLLSPEYIDEFLLLARDKRWTKLRLSKLGLKEIPEALFKLTALQSLSLSSNSISLIPESIGNLTTLQSLNINNNKINLLPDSLCQIKSLQSLYISFNDIKNLPKQIENLNSLKTLNICGNKLNCLPKQLMNATTLHSLYISDNQITNLPEWLRHLKSLHCLDLDRNQISLLPEWMGQMTALQSLYISYNQISQLPESLGQLSSLQLLTLNANKIKQIPESIGQLFALQSLYLSNNQLTHLPESFGNLTTLQRLDLNDNKLSKLPESIGNLTALRRLDLNGNKLNQLPESIGNLTALQRLDLDENQLSQLPESFGNLTALQRLNLNQNILGQLPESMGQLTALQVLVLNANKLSQLPKSIGNLTALQSLLLGDNKLRQLPESLSLLKQIRFLEIDATSLDLPVEITATRDALTILSHYFDKNKTPLREAKLIMVGQGGVGKTSLVKRLMHNSFDAQETKTEGIALHQWHIDTTRGKVCLNIWDFGGQEIMHATHQFFLTERSAYVLVWDARQEDRYGQLEYWLELIRSFGKDSPVLVVMNKCETGAKELDEAALLRKYNDNIKDKNHFLAVSCQTGQGIAEVRAKLSSILAELKSAHTPWRNSWFKVKSKIQELQQSSPILKYETFTQLCSEEGIAEQRDQDSLIRYLHDLGVVICFRDDPYLSDNAILEPTWVTEGVYTILNSEIVRTRKGIVLDDDLQDILDSEQYHLADQRFILNMMRKFELCFELEEDQYLIPELLSPQEPRHCSEFRQNAPMYVFDYNILPGSIISRLIVRMHRWSTLDGYWKNGIRLNFEMYKTQALVSADMNDKRIEIFVYPMNTKGSRIVLSAILCFLHGIHTSIARLTATGKIPIPDAPEVCMDHSNLQDQLQFGIQKFMPPGTKHLVNIQEHLRRVELLNFKEYSNLLKLLKDDYFINNDSFEPYTNNKYIKFIINRYQILRFPYTPYFLKLSKEHVPWVISNT